MIEGASVDIDSSGEGLDNASRGGGGGELDDVTEMGDRGVIREV
jgi:hypothetical protein